MLSVEELRVAMLRKGYTQKQLAKEIGMSEQTLTRKLKKKKMGLDEADKIIEVLQIDNPAKIFFAEK